MEHLPITPPGWAIAQLLLVTAVVYIEWQILGWLRSKIK